MLCMKHNVSVTEVRIMDLFSHTFPSTSVMFSNGDSALVSKMRDRAKLACRPGTKKLRGNGECDVNHGRVRLA